MNWLMKVHILDENDHDPVFSDGASLRTVRQTEGNRVGAVIARLTATDRDQGQNARVSYSIRPLDGTADNAFSVIADTGDLVANTRLDYETRREYRYEPCSR